MASTISFDSHPNVDIEQIVHVTSNYCTFAIPNEGKVLVVLSNGAILRLEVNELNLKAESIFRDQTSNKIAPTTRLVASNHGEEDEAELTVHFDPNGGAHFDEIIEIIEGYARHDAPSHPKILVFFKSGMVWEIQASPDNSAAVAKWRHLKKKFGYSG